MEDQETILRRIQKLFALAGNNPDEAEVQSAMLKAQELLLKHGLNMETVNGFHEQEDEDISIKEGEPDQGGKRLFSWQVRIAQIIAKNFRCKTFRWKDYRDTSMHFFGQAKDVDAAVETANFIYAVAPKLWLSFYSKWQDTPGNFTWNKRQTYALKNDYFMGFMEGLKDKFAEQVQSKDLIIIIPNAVFDAYKDRSRGFVRFKVPMDRLNNAAAKEQGYRDGKGATEKHKYIS